MPTTGIFIVVTLVFYVLFRMAKAVGKILKRAREAQENAKPIIKLYGKEKGKSGGRKGDTGDDSGV